MERERELQQRYGELLMEREALVSNTLKYWATPIPDLCTMLRASRYSPRSCQQLVMKYISFFSLLLMSPSVQQLRLSAKGHLCFFLCNIPNWLFAMLIGNFFLNKWLLKFHFNSDKKMEFVLIWKFNIKGILTFGQKLQGVSKYSDSVLHYISRWGRPSHSSNKNSGRERSPCLVSHWCICCKWDVCSQFPASQVISNKSFIVSSRFWIYIHVHSTHSGNHITGI